MHLHAAHHEHGVRSSRARSPATSRSVAMISLIGQRLRIDAAAAPGSRRCCAACSRNTRPIAQHVERRAAARSGSARSKLTQRRAPRDFVLRTDLPRSGRTNATCRRARRRRSRCTCRSCDRLKYSRPWNALMIGPELRLRRHQPAEELRARRARADRRRRRAPAATPDRAGPRPGSRGSIRDREISDCGFQIADWGGGRHRPRLHDPELPAVVAPLDVLRRAVVPLDPRQDAGELVELRRRQRRDAAGVLTARAGRADSTVASPLRTRNSSGSICPLTSASPSPRPALIDELVGAGDRVDRERDAGGHRRHHLLHEHGDRAPSSSAMSRASRYARACADPRRAPARQHRLDQPIALDVQLRLVDAGERVPGAVLADARGSHREARARRHRRRTTDRLASSRIVARRSASIGITRPSGTGNPACRSRAQLNALPPTRARSRRRMSSSLGNIVMSERQP